MTRFLAATLLLLLCALASSAQITINSNSGTGTSSTVTTTPSTTNEAALFLDEVACADGSNCNGLGGAIGGWSNLGGNYSTGSFSIYSQFNSSSSAVTVGETWTGGSYAWLAALSLFPTTGGTSGPIFFNGSNQTSTVTSVSGTNSVNLNFTHPVASGDQFLILINTNGGSFTAGVNDTDSNSYDQIGNPNGESGNLEIRVFICFAPQVSGTPTITVGLGGIATNIDVAAHEFALTGGQLLPPTSATTTSHRAFVIRYRSSHQPHPRGAWDRKKRMLLRA